MRVKKPLIALLLSPLTTASTAKRTAWVVESPAFAVAVRSSLSTSWELKDCGANGAGCAVSPPDAEVVIGRADALDLTRLPRLKLAQSSTYFYAAPKAVPSRAAIATATGFWPQRGVEQIAEWCIAAIFQDVYRLAAASAAFVDCAFAADAPSSCAAASEATNHTMVSDLTIGIYGYGRIGSEVARRAAALGATVIGTKRSGPFVPPPPPLKWLSPDNDRLLREADVVVLTVPGTGHASTAGLVNRTSLLLMRPHALLVPVSAGPINFGDLEAVLRDERPKQRAVIDTWPGGCWHYPNASCGPPLGPPDFPGSPVLARLPNVLPLPSLSMRDAAYWRSAADSVARNLDALANGKPLEGVVRNASDVVSVII